MNCHEYKVIDTAKHVEEELNKLGAEGWRVVGVTTSGVRGRVITTAGDLDAVEAALSECRLQRDHVFMSGPQCRSRFRRALLLLAPVVLAAALTSLAGAASGPPPALSGLGAWATAGSRLAFVATFADGKGSGSSASAPAGRRGSSRRSPTKNEVSAAPSSSTSSGLRSCRTSTASGRAPWLRNAFGPAISARRCACALESPSGLESRLYDDTLGGCHGGRGQREREPLRHSKPSSLDAHRHAIIVATRPEPEKGTTTWRPDGNDRGRSRWFNVRQSGARVRSPRGRTAARARGSSAPGRFHPPSTPAASPRHSTNKPRRLPRRRRDHRERGTSGSKGAAAHDRLRGQGRARQPAEVLLQEARDADLSGVGNRGHGGFASLLLGSVSHQVVHHASCPVTVVHEANG